MATTGAKAWRVVAALTSTLILTVLAGACSSGGETAAPTSTTSPEATTTTAAGTTTTAPTGSTAESGGADWQSYGHDLANTRFNPDETAINVSTVDALAPSWTIDGLVGVTGTPTVVDGVAYFGDWTGTVHAVDAETGVERWNASIGGWVVGAPAVDGEGVYASSGRTLFRLDRATGAEVWQAETNPHPLAQINASPVVADGLVFQGVASIEVVVATENYSFRGSIGAWDAETGAEVWRFFTTPNDPTSGAGVGVWSTPAVDLDRGLLYVGTGNTYAEPTAPLADSILAIEYATGTLRWSQQFTYPDVYSTGHPDGKDADVGASPNLWTSDGRDLVGAGDKGGVYHALDRETGDVVWETTLTPGSVLGGEIGSAAFADGRLIAVSNVGDPATNGPTNAARAFALDPATGDILWTAEEFDGMIFGPVGSVPGLAFVGTDAGLLVALDVATGERLWSHQAPTRTGCGPSIVDGRVLWGYGFTFFGGAGEGGVISFAVD